MSTKIRWSHQARLDPVAISTPQAREFVCDHLRAHHLPYLVEDVRLVVSELVTNAVLHARSPLTVTLEEQPSCVKLTVHDSSPDPPIRVTADIADTGGRGMDLIAQFSSSWGTATGIHGDKSVWATFAVRPAQVTPEPALGQVGNMRRSLVAHEAARARPG